MPLRLPELIGALGMVLALLLGACQTEAGAPAPLSGLAPDPTPSPDRVITLGDIDPDEPTKRILRLQPLAEYLADNLTAFGIEAGRVVVARSVQDMAGFLKDGTVDIYFDSAFPVLATQELSGSRVILRRWKQADAVYWNVYIARAGSGVSTAEDFVGKITAFEEPYSTSGYVLPAGTLIRRGFTLTRVEGPGAEPHQDAIGYFFSRDEENTIELVLQGQVAGGGISNQDYEALPEELKEKIIAFDQTVSVPRQLVSVRPGLEPGLVDKVRAVLIGLDRTPEGLSLLEGLKDTKKFDDLPSDSESSLQELRELMGLVAAE